MGKEAAKFTDWNMSLISKISTIQKLDAISINKLEIQGTPDWDQARPFSHMENYGHDIWNLMPACGPNSNTSFSL